ncbi:hypothetical protein IID24_02385 [Patescibacteria group bacterium]|nr:hypothetical protein [Patescibacteria group bacterium]
MQRTILLLGLMLIAIRAWVYSFIYLFGNTEFAYRLLNDSIHHYQLGIVLLPVGVIFLGRQHHYIPYLLIFTFALAIEEHAVLLSDLGMAMSYVYMSFYDVLIVLSLAAACILTPVFTKVRKFRSFVT